MFLTVYIKSINFRTDYPKDFASQQLMLVYGFVVSTKKSEPIFPRQHSRIKDHEIVQKAFCSSSFEGP
jgi:hypothetical protein